MTINNKKPKIKITQETAKILAYKISKTITEYNQEQLKKQEENKKDELNTVENFIINLSSYKKLIDLAIKYKHLTEQIDRTTDNIKTVTINKFPEIQFVFKDRSVIDRYNLLSNKIVDYTPKNILSSYLKNITSFKPILVNEGDIKKEILFESLSQEVDIDDFLKQFLKKYIK